MKKIIVFGIVFLLMVAITIGVIIVGNADFVIPEYIEPRRYSGNITFLADGKPAVCYLNEPNMNIDDDFEECLKINFGGKRITNAKDWTNRDYKSVVINGTEYRSFNEDKLNDLINS